MFKFLNLLLLSFLIVSCASQGTKDQLKMRQLVEENNFTAAIELLEKSDFKKNKSDHILYLMELGSLHFYEGKFLLAAQSWQKALELISALYTKVSQVTSGVLISENLKDYAPKDYEISYLYYYQSMAFFYEYLNTQDRKFLLQARASIIAWDVYLQNIKVDNKFKNLYFEDFYARFFAGLIHETMGERADQEIAFQLYKDAYQLFLLQAPTYTNFSTQPTEVASYIDELMKTVQSKENWRDKLKSLAQKNIKNSNPNFQKTRELIASKIISLAKIIRKNEVTKLRKEYELKDESMYNAIVLLHQGWMTPLAAKKIRLSLSAASKDGSASQAVLAAIAQAGFLVFASKILGPTNQKSTGPVFHYSIYSNHDFTETIASAASLEFEIPFVDNPKLITQEKIKISHAGSSEEKNVDLFLLQSFDDILFQSIERQKALDLFFKGTRFATKHIAAMLGSYSMYKGMVANNSNNEGLAKLAAFGSYLAAAKLISISEEADLRYWSLLPANICFAPLEISNKVEELQITKPDGSTQQFKLPIDRSNKKQLQIIPLRH